MNALRGKPCLIGLKPFFNVWFEKTYGSLQGCCLLIFLFTTSSFLERFYPPDIDPLNRVGGEPNGDCAIRVNPFNGERAAASRISFVWSVV